MLDYNDPRYFWPCGCPVRRTAARTPEEHTHVFGRSAEGPVPLHRIAGKAPAPIAPQRRSLALARVAATRVSRHASYARAWPFPSYGFDPDSDDGDGWDDWF